MENFRKNSKIFKFVSQMDLKNVYHERNLDKFNHESINLKSDQFNNFLRDGNLTLDNGWFKLEICWNLYLKWEKPYDFDFQFKLFENRKKYLKYFEKGTDPRRLAKAFDTL